MPLTERLALLVDAKVEGAVRDIKTLAKESSRTDDTAKKLEARGKAIGTAWKVGVGVAASAALVKMAQLSGQAVEDASALGETVNKVGVVFEDQADKVLAFGEDAAKSLGQSKQGALSAAATFGLFFDAAGLAGDAASDMSLKMVTLASDMASFNDADPSEVLDNLRSGLAGESEPLRKFGVFLNEAAVASKAAELGLQGVNGKLTDGEKIQARYAIILDQTVKQQGDFARTSDSLANKQRTANALMENASAALGEGLLPAQLAVTNAFVDAAPAISAVAKGTGGLVKSFTDLPGPLQAVLASSTLLSGGFLVLGPRIAETRAAMKELGAEAPRTTKALNAVGKAAGAFTVILALDAAIDGLSSSMRQALPTTEELAGVLLDMRDGSLNDAGKQFNDLAGYLDNLGTAADKAAGFLDFIPNVTGLLPGENAIEEADRLAAAIEGLDDALASLVTGGSADLAKQAFEDFAAAEDLTAEQQEKLLTALPAYRDALAGVANQTKIAAGATDGLTTATGKSAEATKRMEERQERLAEKLKKARGEARETAAGFVGLTDAVGDNEVSLGGWIRRMERSAAALEAFRENAIKAAKRGLDEGLIRSLEEAGPEGALRMRQLANATKEELERANKAWREGQREIRAWVNFKVPPKRVEVTVDTSALDGLAYRLSRMSQGYKIPVKTLAEPRAGGGPVTGGEPYLVGEEGPELFVPRQSGTIVPNGSLARAGGSGGGTWARADREVETFARTLAKTSLITERHAKRLLDSAEEVRDGIRGRIRSLKQDRAGIASAFAGSFGQTVFGGEATTVQSILGARSQQARDALAVNQAISALIKKGVSEDVLRELAAGGIGGFEQIKALAGADAAQIAEFNKLTQIANSNLLAAGGKVGGALLNDDIAAAKQAEKIAAAIERQLEKALSKRDENTTITLTIGPKAIRATLAELKRKNRGSLGLD